ncbi:MAG: glycosyltransferase family 9 protein [Proteobacteria bacterium]|nr:glycosyltransferase family 9 protein [Pseudomonadota bacterium]
MKRVLVIKMSALGDVVMAAPHIEAVARAHPGDEVWLLTGPVGRDLFEDHPRIRLAVLDRSSLWGEKSLWGRVQWMRRTGFDKVFDLQGNRTSRRLVRWGRPGFSVGTQPLAVYDRAPAEPYLPETQQNVFDRLNDTLKAGGLDPAPARARFHISEQKAAVVAQWMEQNRVVEQGFAVFHAGSAPGWESKRWPARHWAELADRVDRAGFSCVWVGSASDAQVNRGLAARTGHDATDLFSPAQVHELARHAAFGAASDSAPMHLFAAAGIPVYGFFGPTSRVRSHALGQGDRVLFGDAPCSPCFLGTCPRDRNHACLEDISPGRVFARINQDLGLLTRDRNTI